ncbi:unnamed protein product [Prorocentrum cordatum]|uniref:Initiation-specific alpha-1,6-mannosyltransferase n=1 Tax=Prorocentrum cordatum TaxID=2364126 RepID=A0ABN9XL14_9DINO|nr:unnamed protein product [Polarella glacialis]
MAHGGRSAALGTAPFRPRTASLRCCGLRLLQLLAPAACALLGLAALLPPLTGYELRAVPAGGAAAAGELSLLPLLAGFSEPGAREGADPAEGGPQTLPAGVVLVNDSVMEVLTREAAWLPPDEIPKWIHTTWESWTGLSADERRAAGRWVELNPGWRYYFWDDGAVQYFLGHQMSSSEERDMLNEMKKIEVMDVFRYVLMERLGGLYCDIDVEPVLPIEQWTDVASPRPQLVTGWESRFTNSSEKDLVGFARMSQVQQWLIMSAPHHPVLKDVLVRISSLFKTHLTEFGIKLGTLELTGPGPWTDAVLAHVAPQGELSPPAGHGEGSANEVHYDGPGSVWVLPKECFAWSGFPPDVGNESAVLAKHHFKMSWHT